MASDQSFRGVQQRRLTPIWRWAFAIEYSAVRWWSYTLLVDFALLQNTTFFHVRFSFDHDTNISGNSCHFSSKKNRLTDTDCCWLHRLKFEFDSFGNINKRFVNTGPPDEDVDKNFRISSAVEDQRTINKSKSAWLVAVRVQIRNLYDE